MFIDSGRLLQCLQVLSDSMPIFFKCVRALVCPVRTRLRRGFDESMLTVTFPALLLIMKYPSLRGSRFGYLRKWLALTIRDRYLRSLYFSNFLKSAGTM